MNSGRVRHHLERSCGECEVLLVNKRGVVVKEVFLYDYRVWCIDCLRHLGLIDYCSEGENVLDRDWYQKSSINLEEMP
ncbi:MAG: hypothetical protein HQL14_06990 [Candidatus Omnitrophica bacterium]|nr:hypothetical protein [Candidatus Omnitrophota bacterium]